MVESGVDDFLMQMLREGGGDWGRWSRAVARFPESEKVGGHQVRGGGWSQKVEGS